MATAARPVTPPPLTAEAAVSPESATASLIPPPLTAEAAVSPESPGLTPISDHPSKSLSHSPKLGTLQQLPPPFFNSIAELKDLSVAISDFHQCYDELQNHLNSIKAAILAKVPSEAPQISQPTAPFSLKHDISDGSVLQNQQEEQNTPESELVGLCKTMCSRGVRKYLATHLSNRPLLREQVPKALRHAPNPPKLVLECLGKFYLQGSKAFTRNSPMIPAREASILILECFIFMMEMDIHITSERNSEALNIEKAVKEEADASALAWRKRLVSEGGVAKASQIDARGLLLFVACFGIPDLFQVEDMRDLVFAANAREIVGVLHKSRVLMSKISDIVESMLKKKMEVDAVDIVYTFGLEERFNPHTILVSFLRESKETWKKSRKGSHGSPATLNEANKKQLASLKAISKCLERHKIDPSKFLPGWQINDKITSLEKDISNLDRKSSGERKRKASEAETSSQKAKGQEAKRSRYGLQKAGGSSHVMDSSSRRNNLLDINYSASQAPLVYGGPGAGLLPQQSMMIPQHGGPTSIISTYAVYAAGQLINTNRHATTHYHHHPYVWHRDSAMDERYDTTDDNTTAASSVGVGLTSLHSGALMTRSIEGFAGNNVNPNATPSFSLVGGGGGRSSAAAPSDLYHFADSVAETELLYQTAVPPAAHDHSSSSLYQV